MKHEKENKRYGGKRLKTKTEEITIGKEKVKGKARKIMKNRKGNKKSWNTRGRGRWMEKVKGERQFRLNPRRWNKGGEGGREGG